MLQEQPRIEDLEREDASTVDLAAADHLRRHCHRRPDGIASRVETVPAEALLVVQGLPEHPAGLEPLVLSHPNALVNESTGGALKAAGLIAEQGADATKLTEALKAVGLAPAQNIKQGEAGKMAEGDSVGIMVDTGTRTVSFDGILKSAFPEAKTDYVFLGNTDVQKAMACG